MDRYIIKLPDGKFIKDSDGHPLEHFDLIKTDKVIEAKTFVSEKTALRWADAYRLEDIKVKDHNLQAAKEIKDDSADKDSMAERYIKHFKRHLPDQCPIPVVNIDGHKVLKDGDNRLYFWLGRYESRLRDFLPEDIKEWLKEKDANFQEVLDGKKDILEWDVSLIDMETDAFAETYNVEW